MSISPPYPMHVPTLTEVVEETPIPEVDNESAGGAVVTDFAVSTDLPDLSEPALAHDLAVLTEVVPDSDVLPPVAELLDAPDLSDDGKVVAAAEAGVFTEELTQRLTDQITENLTSALTPMMEGLVEHLMQSVTAEVQQRLRQMVAQAVAQELGKRAID